MLLREMSVAASLDGTAPVCLLSRLPFLFAFGADGNIVKVLAADTQWLWLLLW